MIDIPTDLKPLVLQGHVVDKLRELPPDSIHCVVSSPPYFGLRLYGTPPQVWGGDPFHGHEWTPTMPRRKRKAADATSETEQRSVGGRNYDAIGGETCPCGAWRGEMGLEPTPDLFVDHLASVFDEVRRVLRPDGVVFLNLGDTFSTHPAGLTGAKRWKASTLSDRDETGAEQAGAMDKRSSGLPEKSLIGIPWRVAFELQRRGWILRSDVVWAKPNCMPESARDRPTRSHEYVFLLTRGPRYFYDQDAVRNTYAQSTMPEIGEKYRGTAAKPYREYGAQDASDAHRSMIQIVGPARRLQPPGCLVDQPPAFPRGALRNFPRGFGRDLPPARYVRTRVLFIVRHPMETGHEDVLCQEPGPRPRIEHQRAERRGTHGRPHAGREGEQGISGRPPARGEAGGNDGLGESVRLRSRGYDPVYRA